MVVTIREREVLQQVADGSSNKEVARELYIAPETVKSHLESIFIKLGASSRTHAVAIALRLGIIL